MKQFRLKAIGLLGFFLLANIQVQAQDTKVVEQIMEKTYEDSQLEYLAHQLMDVVGPRLVGTPQMKNAHDWVIEQYKTWGIEAENQQYGEWRAWERGITHIDMIEPRVQSLSGTQLAWSPATPKKGTKAEVIVLPENIKDSISFARWLPQVKGKIVMTSMPEITGRPDRVWEEFATPESFEKMKEERQAATKAWYENISKTGYTARNINEAIDKAGAAGIITSYWSKEHGSNKIFGTTSKKAPVVDLSLEDYGMLYRLVKSGQKPVLNLKVENSGKGTTPTFNTVATIPGTEKADEFVILSAHLDSWDGGTGATDNGTGTIAMMEAARILKEVYPNPKRTIIIGHWGSEEQGLNGSRAYVEDHPEIIAKTTAIFNQDNGTGRVVNISGQGFLHAYDYLGRWLHAVPQDIRKHIKTNFPGYPSSGGTDHASFVAAGAPGFMLSSLNWQYGPVTWHTNLDTYDKIIFDDVKNNVALIAILAYMASEDPEFASRERINLPLNPRTSEQGEWPTPRSPNRKGGM